MEAARNFNFSKTNYRQEINDLYYKYINLLKAAQNSYDSETDNGRNADAQEQWANKMTQWLKELKL